MLYPPFLLKTKVQVARGATEQSAIQVARATLREEGIRGLYKVKVEGKPPAQSLLRCTRQRRVARGAQ